MNAITKLHFTTPLPRIARIDTIGDLTVRVSWASGIRANRNDMVDLSPLINSLKFYRPLRSNPDLFRTIHLIERGTIVAWDDNDEIDIAADSIEQLAEESMTPDDFRDFLKSSRLTHNEAAALLGRSRRQIENYLSGHEHIPRIVVMACFGLAARSEKLRGLNIIQIDPQETVIENISSGVGTAKPPTPIPIEQQQGIQRSSTSASILSDLTT
jgi:hypothetical protein